MAANCLIYEGMARKRFPFVYGTVVVALFAISLAFGVVRLREPMQGNIRTSIVQGNIRQDLKFDEAYKNRIIQTYSSLTLERARSADLVIWPETAMPFVFLGDPASAECPRDSRESFELPSYLARYHETGKGSTTTPHM